MRIGLAAALTEDRQPDEAIRISGEALDICAAHDNRDDVDAAFDGGLAAVLYAHALGQSRGMSDSAALEEAFHRAPSRRAPFIGLALAQSQWESR